MLAVAVNLTLNSRISLAATEHPVSFPVNVVWVHVVFVVATFVVVPHWVPFLKTATSAKSLTVVRHPYALIVVSEAKALKLLGT